MTTTADRPPLTKAQRILAAVVVGCVAVIAVIGFAGSYTAVTHLAVAKGFGWFAFVLPAGIDAGILAFLALDLLLTWLRMPYPLLRQTAWLLTAATIAFNGAAAWPDPLGVGMHSAIPILFVVAVEAARHAIGRIADITADRHMESVRLIRWLLAFPSTFRLWRRMKLWEMRSYDEAIRLEQDLRLYQDELRDKYGRSWRRKAPTGELRPLRLARYGKPITATTTATTAKTVICAGLMGVEIERTGERPSTERKALTTSAHERAQTPHSERTSERTTKPSGERRERARTTPKTSARKSARASATKSVIERRRERARRLYDELGERPEWTQIRDALVADKLAPQTISRPTIQRIRDAIEKAEPNLAALGSANVRALTG